jgi:carbon monoxide dehydrogenase subunit G
MTAVSRTFTVSPPPDLVVDYLKDFGHAEEWDPGTRRCERIDSGPVAEGAFWHNVSTIFGVTAELTYRLEELSDREVVFVGENALLRAIGTITVDAEGSGSLVTYVAELEMHGTAMLLRPVAKLLGEKRAARTETRMATVLDQLVTADNQAGGARR